MNKVTTSITVIIVLMMLLVCVPIAQASIEITVDGSPIVLNPECYFTKPANLINSTDDVVLLIYLKNTGDETAEDVTMTLTAPAGVGIDITDSTYNYGNLTPDVSVMGFFRVTTTNTPVGDYSLSLNGLEVNVTVVKFTKTSENYIEKISDIGKTTLNITERYPDTNSPTKFSSEFYPKTPFTGVHHSPPLIAWKPIVAAACTIACRQLAALDGEVTNDEACACIAEDALCAALVGCDEDLIWIGEENTPPGPNEVTLCETVDANITYLSKPELGKSYQYIINWTFTRVTNVTTYTYSSSETETHNLYFEGISDTDKDAYVSGENIIITTDLSYPNGTAVTGRYAYVRGSIYTNGYLLVPWIILRDDGHWTDETPNDGIYTGNYSIKDTDYSGTTQHPWHITIQAIGSRSEPYCDVTDPVDVPDVDTPTPEIPEFTTIAIPVTTILGLVFLFSRRRRKE